MSEPICTIGHQFQGVCSACDGATVTGTMISGEDKACINGQPICVTGDIGQGSCGHTTQAVGQSTVFFINGNPVVRVGDPVQGTITGTITTGEENATAD